MSKPLLLAVVFFALGASGTLRAQPATPPVSPAKLGGIRDVLPNVWLGMTLTTFLRARPKAEEFTLGFADELPKRVPLSARKNAVLMEKLKSASFPDAIFFFKNKSLRQISLVNDVRADYEESRVRLTVADLLQRFGRPNFVGVTPLLPHDRDSKPRFPGLIWNRSNATVFARFSYPPMVKPVRGVKEGQVEVTFVPTPWPHSQRQLPLFVKPNANDETRILAPLRALINELQPGPAIKLPMPSLLPKPLPRPTLSPPNAVRAVRVR